MRPDPSERRPRFPWRSAAGGRHARRRRPAAHWEPCEGRVLLARTVSISDPTVIRSDTTTEYATFQVTLSSIDVEEESRVTYTTVDGSATAANGDYVPQLNGMLTIPIDSNSATIQIAIPPKVRLADSLNFSVMLTGATSGTENPLTIGVATAQATIIDANLGLSISDATVDRSDTSTQFATFQVTLTPADPEVPVTVQYATQDGTATAAAGDYVPQSGTLTFPVGVTTETIKVAIPPKTRPSGTSTFFVNLSNPDGDDGPPILITRGKGVGTIVDNNASGQFQFSSPSYSVGEAAGPAVITVTRTGGSATEATVSFATVAGTAIAGQDFQPTSGTLDFKVGQTTATFTVPIFVDLLALADRSFSVVLGGPTGGAILGTPAVATVTIREVNPLIVTNTNDSGLGSLRQAILTADALPFSTIRFAIPGAGVHVITPPSALPPIIHPTAIDAATQPGFAGMPLVDLVGAALPTSAGFVDGLVVTAGGTLIRGLAIGLFPGSGLLLSGGGGNVVLNTDIGTDATGTVAAGNVVDGIDIADSSGNIIGGAGAADVISGNGSTGIRIVGTSSGNVIQATWIGTDAAGRAAIPNLEVGILIDDASRNVIGVPGAGDLISGNGSVGVLILDHASGNVVQASLIGTDITGASALPNVDDGIFLADATGNVIGGPGFGQANVISGNGSVGVQILGADGGGNVLLGNRIGTNAAGSASVPNVDVGVYINSAPGNVVGQAGAGNLLSGNGSVGVEIFGTTAFGNVVQADMIGTDATGHVALPNGLDGIFIDAAPNNLIGGLLAVQGDVISGNGSSGVQIFDAGATGNVILGDRIGTNAAGTAALANHAVGVYINDASGNVVGQAGGGNLLSGNGSVGLLISGALAAGNVAQANKIGTDITGLIAVPNRDDGVFIDAAPANVLGGTGAGQGNLISGNGTVGLQILGAVAAGMVVQGNLIGTDALGRPTLGNAYGVFLNGFVVDASRSGITTRNVILGNRVANIFQQPA